MAPPEPKKPDPLVLLARASAAKRRRSWLPSIILVLLVAALLGGLAWWIWPRGGYPAVALAAFDQIVLPGKEASLTLRLEPIEPVEGDAHLAGSKLFLLLAGSQDYDELEAGADGFAGIEKRLPPDLERIDLDVRFPGVSGRRRGTQTRGQVFVWPADARLLVVDADTALAEGDMAVLWRANNLDLKLRPDVAATLQAASRSYRIVYWSGGADGVLRYNKVRAWLSSLANTPKEGLPLGPLLAPASVPEDQRERFPETALADLGGRFKGPGVGVTRDPELARLFQQAHFESCLLGEASAPPEAVHVVPSWTEVTKRLKP